MMMRESAYSHRAADESLPLRDAFSVLFFVSVGMLFDPQVLLTSPLKVLGVVAVIMLGKTLAAIALVLALRYPLNTALTVGASLAQIGEFSFILAGLGVALGLLPREGQSLILAGALISIALNSLLFTAIEPAKAWILRRSNWARRMEMRDDPLAELPASTDRAHLQGQVVLVGFGRVGRQIAESLAAQHVPLVVAEQQRELVEDLRAHGVAAVSGDASDPVVLIQAHIARAAVLIVTGGDDLLARRMVETARQLNPGIRVLLRARSEDEARLLREGQFGEVFVAEQSLAEHLTRRVLEVTKPAAPH
ncbi:MAG: NAD-binding protein, partial [Paucibacter sp.]|nr:NAD-binding protein [Roseateles sp.]